VIKSQLSAFRAEERLFVKYAEAERLIHDLALRQRGVDGMGIDDEDD
jgi:hypothetical protein